MALLVPALVAAGLLTAGATPAAAAGPPVQVADFGPNPGALQVYVHRPAGLPAGAPVVVALHGCTRTTSAPARSSADDPASTSPTPSARAGTTA